MPAAADVISDYLHAWNEADPAKRKVLLERCWADDGRYVDPPTDGTGREALDAIIAGLHAQQPGARIEPTSGIDQHHDQVRFAWAFVGADGKTAIEGIDVGELAPDGRLARIVGFWGAPPHKA
jgi:hypothetical protein